jgi:hypothetical protein
MFHSKQCGSRVGIYDLSAVAAVISSISPLFAITINEQCVSSWCGIL